MKKIIEALLLVSQGPLKVEDIQKVLDNETQENIKKYISELQNDYTKNDSAMQITEIAGGWQFSVRKEYGQYIKKLYKKETTIKLSNSAMETLAIIAYKQPITRGEIDKIRGVESGGVVRTLLEKNLVRIAGKKESIGNPALYGTTQQFLLYFGLKSTEDLPSLEDIDIENIEEVANELSEGTD
ncbi:MAG: hypothetical protein BWY26_00098 [Elusimicrobia bacterium ADurb.Bin231]|nr:MAG: hypothetical protein BWY26_00098 [Elusimicrobia bacterium ADurb.Bin231]